MKILVTNDDGYSAKGIKALVEAASGLGEITVIAHKSHQSGMAMAVSMGYKPIAVKDLGVREDGSRCMYLDGTPASCVKFGIDNVFTDGKPDLVLSGVNHGSNAATAACYSGTLGAAQEAAVNGIPAIGVSLDTLKSDADFSAVVSIVPDLLRRIIAMPQKRGSFFNINFPELPLEQIKGVRIGHMGKGHWVEEFVDWDPGFFARIGIDPAAYGISSTEVKAEEGESIYMMAGRFVDDDNEPGADHILMREGYISIVEHNFDNTDYSRTEALKAAGLEADFR